MEICTAKFKVRNPAEALFVTDMVERVKNTAAKYSLPITHIRFGRQVKSWGSTSVADYHVYTYGERSNNADGSRKIEFWVNGHGADLSEAGRQRLEWSMVKGCIGTCVARKLDMGVTMEDVTAFALLHGYKANSKLIGYLTERKQADEITGLNFAMRDEARLQEKAEQEAKRAAAK